MDKETKKILRRTYYDMKQRCLNPNNKYYKDYGGRGIKICDRWLVSSNNFIEDMGERPEGNYSLDRVDNDGPYSPDNCRWSHIHEQNNNMRRGGRVGGVYWHKAGECWRAHIKINGKDIHLGSFELYEDAVIARMNKQKEVYNELYGEE